MPFRKPKLTMEQQMCADIVQWSELCIKRYPALEWLRHWPNEGKRNPWIAKLMGIKAGPSDYFLPVPTVQYNGLFLEIKVPDKKPTDQQRIWLQAMKTFGYYTNWTDNTSKAIKILDWYCQCTLVKWPDGIAWKGDINERCGYIIEH